MAASPRTDANDYWPRSIVQGYLALLLVLALSVAAATYGGDYGDVAAPAPTATTTEKVLGERMVSIATP